MTATKLEQETHILIVDDEPNIVVLMEATLLGEGYQVHTAHGPAEALRVLHEQPIDIILSDHSMPEMTGIELMRIARNMRPNVVRFLLTAHVTLGDAVRAINDGHVHKLIRKPWGSSALTHDVREAAYEASVRRQAAAAAAANAEAA